MKLEEELLKITKDEEFWEPQLISIGQSKLVENMVELSNLITDIIEVLKDKKSIVYQDAEEVSEMQFDVYDILGQILGKVEGFME